VDGVEGSASHASTGNFRNNSDVMAVHLMSSLCICLLVKVPLTSRTLTEDAVVAGRKWRKGTLMWIPTHCIHMSSYVDSMFAIVCLVLMLVQGCVYVCVLLFRNYVSKHAFLVFKILSGEQSQLHGASAVSAGALGHRQIRRRCLIEQHGHCCYCRRQQVQRYFALCMVQRCSHVWNHTIE